MLRREKKLLFVLAGALCPILCATAAPDGSNPTTFLGPTVHVGVANATSDITAYALSGDIGESNVRLDGTFAIVPFSEQRFKFSAEYLFQDVTYGFASGNTSQWLQQGSLGANYEYHLGQYIYRYNPALAIDAYVARSFNKSLRISEGFFRNNSGTIVPSVDTSRIAGATAGGVSPGFTVDPWPGATTGLDLNYDNVSYDRIYAASNDPKGFGATFHYKQLVQNNLELSFSAARRQPFNNYAVHATLVPIPFYGMWTVGVGGEYTIGKAQMPSTYNIGLNINYLVADAQCKSNTEKDETVRFLYDTTHPAGYLPQVLAVRDEQLVPLVTF